MREQMSQGELSFQINPENIRKAELFERNSLEAISRDAAQVVMQMQRTPLARYLLDSFDLRQAFSKFQDLPLKADYIASVLSQLKTPIPNQGPEVFMAIDNLHKMVIAKHPLGTSVMFPILSCTHSAMKDITQMRHADIAEGIYSAESDNYLLGKIWEERDWQYALDPTDSAFDEPALVPYNGRSMLGVDYVAIGAQGFFPNEPLRINIK